jgi:hypothetical protein
MGCNSILSAVSRETLTVRSAVVEIPVLVFDLSVRLVVQDSLTSSGVIKG